MTTVSQPVSAATAPPETPIGPPRPDYKTVRKEMVAIIGRDRFNELSKGSVWLDAWWTIWPLLAVVVTAVAIGVTDNWWIRVPLIAFNGFNITNCAVVGHSLCTHRRVWGRRGSQVAGTFMHTISLLSFSVYTKSHHTHHNTVNTPEDQDWEVIDLDRRWKRWLYLTIPGYMLASSRAFAPKESKHLTWNARAYARKELMADPARRWDVIVEAVYVGIYWVAIAAACFWKPEFFFLGYVVPLLATSAMANGLREAYEHQGVDVANPYHVAAAARIGLFRRAFMHQTGTTHWVHHMWPNMPHYRCTAIWDELYPHLRQHGIVEDRSFIQGLRNYYIEGEQRAHWTDETGGVHQINTLSAYGDAEFAAAHR